MKSTQLQRFITASSLLVLIVTAMTPEASAQTRPNVVIMLARIAYRGCPLRNDSSVSIDHFWNEKIAFQSSLMFTTFQPRAFAAFSDASFFSA